MNAVTAMLERGMRKIRDSLVSFSRQLSNDVDCSDLEDADIVLPIVWRLGAKNVLTAADLTAYQCYDQWHQEVFRGIKRSHDDESYEHESEPSSSDSQASASISSSELAGSSTRAGTKPNKHVKVST
jgi:hypothetical protein